MVSLGNNLVLIFILVLKVCSNGTLAVHHEEESAVVLPFRVDDILTPNQGGIPLPRLSTNFIDYLQAVEASMKIEDSLTVRALEALANHHHDPSWRHLRPGVRKNCNEMSRQIVYLEFPNRPTFWAPDPSAPPSQTGEAPLVSFPGFIFSPQDQEIILERLQADFEGFSIDFVLDQPDKDCAYSTLSFAAPEDFVTISLSQGILFGLAEQVDNFNRDHSDSAFIDVQFWTWLFAINGIDNPDRIRSFSVNQAANTGAHELGHILGLHHYDSFGSQNANGGLVVGPNGVVFASDQQGTETFLHLMASGASVGLPLEAETFQDRFFSERSALKLLLSYRSSGRFYGETKAKQLGGSIGSIEKGISLKKLIVPNTILEGQFAGKNLAASAILIEQAVLETDKEVDEYRFFFQEGSYVNVNVIGFAQANFAAFEDLVITALAIYREDPVDGSLILLKEDLQGDFEGFDPLIFDFQIPETGNYLIQVSAQKSMCFIDGCIDLLEGPGAMFNTGKYDLMVYTLDRPLGSGLKQKSHRQ